MIHRAHVLCAIAGNTTASGRQNNHRVESASPVKEFR